MTAKLTEHDLLIIATALINHQKTLEGLMKRASKRELAHDREIVASRQRHIADIDEVLAKIKRLPSPAP